MTTESYEYQIIRNTHKFYDFSGLQYSDSYTFEGSNGKSHVVWVSVYWAVPVIPCLDRCFFLQASQMTGKTPLWSHETPRISARTAAMAAIDLQNEVDYRIGKLAGIYGVKEGTTLPYAKQHTEYADELEALMHKEEERWRLRTSPSVST